MEFFTDNLLLVLIVFIMGMIAVVVVFILRNQSLPEGNQPKTQIRVLVVDSDAAARDTLTKFLRFDKSIKIVGAASTGSDVLPAARLLDPNVILLDLSLVDTNSIDLAESISRQIPGMRFVFLREDNLSLAAKWPFNLPEPLVKPVDYRQLIEAIHQAERMF